MPAHAEWHEASSPNFLVYADQSEGDIREFTDMLERYRSAMRFIYKLPEEPTSPSNRLTVFVVRDASQVRKLMGDGSRFVRGFYLPRAGGSVAFVPQVEDDSQSDRVSRDEQILLHEYAHHFMFSVFSGSPPLWLQEGFAEFYSTAKFDSSGGVGLGLPADHRAAELALAQEVPLDLLLDTRKYRENASKRYDAFYGRSWLLFHYLTFSDARAGQMASYLQRINAGEGEVAAAVGAFGDLDALDKELTAYMKRRRLTYLNLRPDKIVSQPITIRMLGKGEAAILPVVMRSKRGVNKETAPEVLADARTVAALYPDDPFVLTALAEAEFDAGNEDAAISAADKAIARQPTNVGAMVQKIFALFRKASDEQSLWPEVRAAISAANAAENDNPIPLAYFYRSYAAQGRKPPEMAVQGLQKALQLAPYDTGNRLTLAEYFIRTGNSKAAETTLTPLLNHPHNAELANLARKMLEAGSASTKDGASDSNS
ncbi:tetratricopeptide repeat protein [Blastomonas sp. SL216]|uniref:tetratricopeptide repeat protein n=1 Tax=Blastomonas sp. SL216 TaxID=2995169 RepID=UPI0023779BCA|nr:hypothetical protein OU999_16820 [Blastomonas sp. SL216]